MERIANRRPNHGRPLSGGAWDARILFLGNLVIA
jgi:hypothetical protein